MIFISYRTNLPLPNLPQNGLERSPASEPLYSKCNSQNSAYCYQRNECGVGSYGIRSHRQKASEERTREGDTEQGNLKIQPHVAAFPFDCVQILLKNLI